MIRIRPPHGWDAVAWELVIVTVGVLMALALQQWVENLASQSQTRRTRQAIRAEVLDHYYNAVEWRAFSPCVTGQLERIEARIAGSSSVLRPIEMRHFDQLRAAIMAPNRIYDAPAWQGAIEAGTAFQLSDLERRQLTNEHWAANDMTKLEYEFADANHQLLAATRPIDLDPGVKLSLFRTIDRMHAANELMNLDAAQLLFWAGRFAGAHSRIEVYRDLQQNSVEMRQFCKEQELPMRTLEQAIDPNG